jgi:hypothetical protein
MAETTVELVEEWQTGAFFVLASAFIGVIFMAVFGSNFGPLAGITALVGTGLATFALLSYLLYGR